MQLVDVQVMMINGTAIGLRCPTHGVFASERGLTVQDFVEITVAHIADQHPDDLHDCCRCCGTQKKVHRLTGRNRHLLPCPECDLPGEESRQ